MPVSMKHVLTDRRREKQIVRANNINDEKRKEENWKTLEKRIIHDRRRGLSWDRSRDCRRINLESVTIFCYIE